MSKNIDDLHPAVANMCRTHVAIAEEELGIDLIVTSTKRTFEEQARLYSQGRYEAGTEVTIEGHTVTVPKGRRVTNAKPGRSWHNYGLAYDIAPSVDGKINWNYNPKDKEDLWNKVGEIGISLGLEWGGKWKTFRDVPHFQYRTTRNNTVLSIREMLNYGEHWPQDLIEY